MGISETSNTQALFERADRLQVRYLPDSELNSWQLNDAFGMLEDFIAPLGALYLSIDLDVLPASVAPGVSAPAARGLPLEVMESLLNHAVTLAGDKLRLAEIAECNPELDIDGRTAKVAARLCHLMLSGSGRRQHHGHT